MIPVQETSPGVFQPITEDTLTSRDGKSRHPVAAILHESWSAEDRANYGVYLAQPATVPAGKRVVATSFERVDGIVTQVLTLETVVPSSVTPRQMDLALIAADLDDEVDAYLEAAPKTVRVEWTRATYIDRNNPLLVAAAAALGKTEADLDALFISAAAK